MGNSDEQASVPRGRLVEYAEFIEDQVARARARIKSNDMFRAVLWIITVTLGVLFAEVVLDHFVELPLGVRRGILFGGLALGLIYAWLKIARPMLRRVNTLYAAKSIESTDPHFKNSLINYLQIREDADKVAPSVLAQIEARAVADLSKVNVDDVVDQSPLTRLSYALAAIVVGICLYSWITPKSILDSARRAFLADVQRPTNTRFVNISPGDDKEPPKVVTGLPVTFTVETLGRQPEAVTLFTSRDEGKTFAETPMVQGRSFADPWSVKIDKVPGELLYYMAGGDGRTRTYKLPVLPVAIVEKVSLDYEFPEYTQVPRREAVEEGNVEALQGTRITLTATTNQPARSGFLDFGPKPPVPLLPVPGDPKKLKGTFLVDADGQYAVKFNTMDGQANPEPVLYDIRVVKDLAPTARFIRPESPTLRPANARVPLVIEASDDFGLKEMKLHVYRNGEILQKAVDVIDPKAKDAPKQVQQTVALDLEPLSLKVGDKIQYWVSLRDNCDLQPNKFETPKQTIEIQDPVSEPQREQLAQNEMAQAREETGQQQPMDEQNQGDSQQQQEKTGQQNNQNNQQKQGDQPNQPKQGEEQKKEGQKGGQQGNQSEAADPSANAKEGGQESKGQQQPGQSASKNQQKKQGQKRQAGQNQQPTGDPSDPNSQPGESGNQPDSKQSPMNQAGQPQQKQAGDQKKQGSNQQAGGSDKPEGAERPQGAENQAGNDQPKQTGQQKQAGDPAGKSGEEKGRNGEKGQQNHAASQPKEPMPGGEKGGEPQPGDEKGQSGEKPQPMPGQAGQNQSGDKSESEPGQKKGNPGDQPQSDPGQKEATGKKAGEKGSNTEKPEKGQSDQGSGDKPKPEQGPEAGQPGEKEGQPQEGGEPSQKQSPQNLSNADRDKLEKLRQALGMNNEPREAGEKGQEKAGNGEKGETGEPSGASGEKGQEKGESGEPGQEKGQSGKEAGEKGQSGKEAGEKGQSGKEAGEKGQSGKEAGEKGQSGKEAGEKGQSGKEAGEKGQSGKEAGEKGQSGKEAGEKGQSGEEAGEKGQSGKEAGEKGESGDQGKQAGQKGESGEKGESGKKPGGQPGGEGEKPGGEKGKGEEGKSKEAGEEKGQPGAMPKGTPKAGGMREGGDAPTARPDDTTPSPRAQEPDQAEPGENLSPQQKADQRLLKRLREMVDKNEISKELEQSTGLSREEINQFVRKFEAPKAEPRDPNATGGTTEVSSRPGNQDENRKVSLPGNLPGGQVTSRNARNSGMVADDATQGNLEGARSRIPSALRSRFEAYQKGLSRVNGRSTGTSSNSSAKAESGSDR